ncbi:hypothetical protein [Brachybacterium squillarum]|uniref:hypothetical protein n=1 Tax=Brachybacterium squillarum TaxID=661979 RepID=UPI00026295AD|nr:hypothetical protein [Brachybacterium squillarum]
MSTPGAIGPSGTERALPPLRDLPSPSRLPEEDTSLAPPAEIIAESRAALRRRLLRTAWLPCLILLALWYGLILLYIWGAAPTFWLLSLLVSAGSGMGVRTVAALIGLDRDQLALTNALLPIGATALSLALIPLAVALIAPLAPRTFLSEQAFQRTVSRRLATVMIAPPLLTVPLLLAAVVLGVRMPWGRLGAGPLMATCLALLLILLAWACIARWWSAPRVLGVKPAADLERTARLDRDHDRRRAAARQVLAQDRRHLPPTPASPESRAALSPVGLLRSLRVIAAGSVAWVAIPVLVLGWLVMGTADAVLLFARTGASTLADAPDVLAWPVAAVCLPIGLLVLLAVAASPGVAALLSARRRAEVRDLRTYADWAVRARVNAWEVSLVRWTGVLAGLAVALGATTAGIVLAIAQQGDALTATWLVLDVLVLAPLVGLGTAAGMRRGARDVFYGPAGRYMRRESSYALVAPELGTRADRAADPAVRAAQRRRLLEQHGEHAAALMALDTAGERLWVDGSEPGARDTAVRAADVSAGNLPDFGAEGSPFAAPPARPEQRHGIPGSVSGLHER